jgi:signal transduction histidine kinase/CheY-like chemotaxis protein
MNKTDKNYQNQTYKNLQLLTRLFLMGLLIVISLNYIFNNMIENLYSQTKILEMKKNTEVAISTILLNLREDISDISVVKSNSKNQLYFKEKINDKIIQLAKNIKELEKIAQTESNVDNQQFYNYTREQIRSLKQYIMLFKLSLNDFNQKMKMDKDSYISEVIYMIKEMQKINNNILEKTFQEIETINKDLDKKILYYAGYQFIAISLVIVFFLYVSHLISNQILKYNKNIEAAKKEAQDMAEKAKEANQAKSNFLANMSHEIRTPLNAILGFIDLLKEKEEDPEKLKYINTIQNSSNALLGVINDILDFSKIESGNLFIEKINFNTYDEFNTMTDLFRAKASEKNISLTLHMDHNNMPNALVSDPLRIKQVIANLLSNAIKFSKNNGRVSLYIEYKNGYLNVAVEDNGIGIPKEKQQDIFKAFSQAESSTTRKYGGTGLGLSISSRLVEMLGGELKLYSNPGVLTRFYFSIPVEIGEYKNNTTMPKLDTSRLKGKHILLVEDNKANQMYMTLLLKKFGLTYDIANDGLEAVHAFEQKSYDLILMDENMPNLNGIEATKVILDIEKNKKLTHTPIIALTANALKGDRERFIDAGMDEYMTKPVSKAQLLEMFTKFLNHDGNEKGDDMVDINELATKMDIDTEDAQMLMNMFMQSANENMHKLYQGILSEDYETIRNEAHSIKGSAANLALDDIYAISKEIEAAATFQKAVDYKSLYNKLGQKLYELVQEKVTQ